MSENATFYLPSTYYDYRCIIKENKKLYQKGPFYLQNLFLLIDTKTENKCNLLLLILISFWSTCFRGDHWWTTENRCCTGICKPYSIFVFGHSTRSASRKKTSIMLEVCLEHLNVPIFFFITLKSSARSLQTNVFTCTL